jgi:hypothetical protein
MQLIAALACLAVLSGFGERESKSLRLHDGDAKAISEFGTQVGMQADAHFPNPFENATDTSPNVVMYAIATSNNTKMAFMLARSEKDNRPWTGSIDCTGYSRKYCVPCANIFANCKNTIEELQLSCEFNGEETFVPLPSSFNCSDNSFERECKSNKELRGDNGHSSFAFGNPDWLTVVCPIPMTQQEQLNRGKPVDVTLKHSKSGVRYPIRTVYSTTALMGRPIPVVRMAAMLYFNLRYHNNLNILKEWMLFMMGQGVSHFFVRILVMLFHM